LSSAFHRGRQQKHNLSSVADGKEQLSAKPDFVVCVYLAGSKDSSLQSVFIRLMTKTGFASVFT
jgi:hypothetical protein